jgi:type VI secretion system protein ImpJ
MSSLPINWHEGLFLQPHHFQAADRYWADLLHTSEHWDHPYGYGLQDISCGFQGTQFRVDRVRARMRDGTLVRREGSDPPLTVELKQAIEQDAPSRVYLCVPQLRPREVNVSREGTNEGARYSVAMREIFDETQSGGNEQMLECRSLNVRLLLEQDDRKGFEYLPIAQVVRSKSGQSAPQLDDQYIPPLLTISAWHQLGRGIVRGVHDMLVQRINELVDMLRDVNIRDHILEVSHAGRFALLDRLNELSTTLGVMLPAEASIPTRLMPSCAGSSAGSRSIAARSEFRTCRGTITTIWDSFNMKLQP